MHLTLKWILCLTLTAANLDAAWAQPLGTPDREQPGDEAIQRYLGRLAQENYAAFAGDLKSLDEWQARLPKYRAEYLYMLGLHPLPEKTPLQATVTGSLDGNGYVVDMIHYQSVPGLYVTGNLYRPARAKEGERLPAVFYVCGHSGRGRDGNKVAYQSHGIWFARHGYVCLVVDTLQLGEIAAIHHGTYRENRWWWHSRGYTSAGVECWNGVRGIDYLISRADVDSARIAVTGISGGGAATFWIAAADERVRVAVPVSGMADLLAYVPNRVINGHCDCMFLYNTFDWPWVRIAGLIAPRPMLFVNSDQDAIFPMDANERVISQLERLYSLYGASDQVDAVVSVGGHAYRKDIRQAAYRFINAHLKGDASPITDSETDLVSEGSVNKQASPPIDSAKLRVFPRDSDLPADQLNTTIDEHFVPLANVAVPDAGAFPKWQEDLLRELRRVVFRSIPNSVPAAKVLNQEDTITRLQTEPEISVKLETVTAPEAGTSPRRVTLVVQGSESSRLPHAPKSLEYEPGEGVYACWPRGTGESQWTVKNPPNYVARSHVLLGRTVDTGRVVDLIATIGHLRDQYPQAVIRIAGEGNAGLLAAYAAVLSPEIKETFVGNIPLTHMDPKAPQFLNILRVADVPEMLGLLAPRQLQITTSDQRFEKTKNIYAAGGHANQITLRAK